jgi:hypothetical protein
MIRSLVLLVGCWASLWTIAAQAQNAVLGQLYGKGVHSYYSGDYAAAIQEFNAAIRAGSRDPRVLYFRGLVYLKYGQTADARRDFSIGAQLESRDINKYYNVARALERVQGAERQMLESYRVQARMAAYAESEKLRKARYEAIKREEARVLQEQIADASKVQSSEPAESAPTQADNAAMEEEKPAAANPEPAANTETEDAFAPKASTEEKPAANKPAVEEDPFAAKPAAAEKPAAENKSAPKKSIFGALGKSLSKTAGIGEKAAALLKPKAQPGTPNAPVEKPADGADPFAK